MQEYQNHASPKKEIYSLGGINVGYFTERRFERNFKPKDKIEFPHLKTHQSTKYPMAAAKEDGRFSQKNSENPVEAR